MWAIRYLSLFPSGLLSHIHIFIYNNNGWFASLDWTADLDGNGIQAVENLFRATYDVLNNHCSLLTRFSIYFHLWYILYMYAYIQISVYMPTGLNVTKTVHRLHRLFFCRPSNIYIYAVLSICYMHCSVWHNESLNCNLRSLSRKYRFEIMLNCSLAHTMHPLSLSFSRTSICTWRSEWMPFTFIRNRILWKNLNEKANISFADFSTHYAKCHFGCDWSSQRTKYPKKWW